MKINKKQKKQIKIISLIVIGILIVSFIGFNSLSIVPSGGIQASEDAYVHQSNPSDNYGDRDYMYVGWTSAGNERIAYIKFDIPNDKLEKIRNGAKITKAEVGVYLSSVDNLELGFFKTDNNWKENSITWSNKPYVGNELKHFSIRDSNDDSYITADITSYLESKINSEEEISVAVKSTKLDEGEKVTIRSKDASSNRPYLILQIDESYCLGGSEKCEGTNYYYCENSRWTNKGEVPGKCGVESEKTYYRLENNQCTYIQLLPSEKTANDYGTYEECYEHINEIPEEPEPEQDTSLIVLSILGILIGIGLLIFLLLWLRRKK